MQERGRAAAQPGAGVIKYYIYIYIYNSFINCFVRVQERGRAAARPGADGRAGRAGVPGLPGGHPGPPGAVTDSYKAVKY